MTIETPIKIIHKIKNNNRRIQYLQYIFIGSNVDESIMNILIYLQKILIKIELKYMKLV